MSGSIHKTPIQKALDKFNQKFRELNNPKKLSTKAVYLPRPDKRQIKSNTLPSILKEKGHCQYQNIQTV